MEEFVPTPSTDDAWLGNLDEIQCTGMTDGDYTIQISIHPTNGDTEDIYETYTTVNGDIELKDLRELLEPYFNEGTDSLLTTLTTQATELLVNYVDRVHLEIYIYEDDPTVYTLLTYNIRYSNIEMPNLHVIEGTDPFGPKFLTRRSEMKVKDGEKALVNTYYNNGVIKADIHYIYMQQEWTREVTLVTLTASAQAAAQLWVYAFTWEKLYDEMMEYVQELVTQDDLIYADIELTDGNGVVKDTIRVIHDKGHYRYRKEFAFIGAMGELEKIALTGGEKMEPELGGTFLQAGNDLQKIRTDLTVPHKVYTGYLNEAERALMMDMARSPKVWLMEDGETIPVTITAIDYEENYPKTEATGLQLTYEVSDRKRQVKYGRS